MTMTFTDITYSLRRQLDIGSSPESVAHGMSEDTRLQFVVGYLTLEAACIGSKLSVREYLARRARDLANRAIENVEQLQQTSGSTKLDHIRILLLHVRADVEHIMHGRS